MVCMHLENPWNPWILALLLFQGHESPWNCLSFILVVKSPWILIEGHFQTSKKLWQIPVWSQQNKIGIEDEIKVKYEKPVMQKAEV